MVVVQKVKTFVMRVVFFCDRWLPLFGKDDIFSYDLNSGKISKLPINSRKYGMQYWCDYKPAKFVSRYSDYLQKKQIGLLFHHPESWKIQGELVLDDPTLICPRYFKEKLLALRPSGDKISEIVQLDNGEVVCELQGNWFDIFSWKEKYYLIGEQELFQFEKCVSDQLKFTLFSSNKMPANGKESSVCVYQEQLFMVTRFLGHAGSAYGSYFRLYESQDLSNWECLEAFFKPHQNKKHQFDGVGFPTLRVRNNELTLFFTGFWGFHLFKKYTIDAWQPKLEKK